MHYSKKICLFFVMLFLLMGCSSPDERVLPTLVPTIDISRPTLPPVGEGELRPYPIVDYENQLLGLNFAHPENWLVRQNNDDLLRLIPDPNSVNDFETFISPSITIQNLTVENGQLSDEIDLSNPAEILQDALDKINADIFVTQEINETTINGNDGATAQYELEVDSLESEDVVEEVGAPGNVTSELAVLINDDHIVLMSFNASSSDFEDVLPIFEDIKESIMLLGIPENPTE